MNFRVSLLLNSCTLNLPDLFGVIPIFGLFPDNSFLPFLKGQILPKISFFESLSLVGNLFGVFTFFLIPAFPFWDFCFFGAPIFGAQRLQVSGDFPHYVFVEFGPRGFKGMGFFSPNFLPLFFRVPSKYFHFFCCPLKFISFSPKFFGGHPEEESPFFGDISPILCERGALFFPP